MAWLRLALISLVVVGCAAEQRSVVPDSEWRTVSQVRRDAVDRAHQADVARLQAEQRAAIAAFVAAQHAIPTKVAIVHPQTKAPETADDWATVVRDYEKTKAGALAEIDTSKASWLTATLAWRQQRVEAANAEGDVVWCAHELAKASELDHQLLGTDHYDTVPFRGQLAVAQERWYRANARATEARRALEQATAKMMAAKETYAKLVRTGPSTPQQLDGRLMLSSFSPADVTARRELHLVVNAAACKANCGLQRVSLSNELLKQPKR